MYAAQVTGTALSAGPTTLLAVASASSVGGQGQFPDEHTLLSYHSYTLLLQGLVVLASHHVGEYLGLTPSLYMTTLHSVMSVLRRDRSKCGASSQSL